ncbi:MAG: SAM-dependent methyltransferase, partial [Cyanobacteriota bacterium]|nr:SAM-dependent methyltransferase [Cyanobacteriota bacterium]
GFEKVSYADRSDQPWQVVEDIEFRAVTLVGQLPDD